MLPHTADGLVQLSSEHDGNGFFIHGSDGVIKYFSDKDYITYIREIRDINTYGSLALLMVTVDESTVRTYFNKVSSDYNTVFFIADEEGNYVVRPEENADEIKQNLLLIRKMKTERHRLPSTEKRFFLSATAWISATGILSVFLKRTARSKCRPIITGLSC